MSERVAAQLFYKLLHTTFNITLAISQQANINLLENEKKDMTAVHHILQCFIS